MAKKNKADKSKRLSIKSIDQQHVDDILELEKRNELHITTSDKIAGYITVFSGSMLYVLLHVVWFAVWIGLNIGLFGLKPFDPFPFSFLTMMVSLEAIFLSAFVLISQNRQSLIADKRAKIDLEVNLMAERENTKMLQLLSDIHKNLGISDNEDAEIKQLKKTTEITKLAKAVEKAEKRKKSKF